VNTHYFDISAHVSGIVANRSLKDALMVKLQTQRVPQRISVTDLLSLKRAYFRRKYPEIAPPLERQQVMWAGTGFHDIFGSLVSSEEYIEQFVEVEGVVGRIDIFETVPVEVKTTTNLSEDADLRLKRPSYVEQLGIYCSMVDTDKGKIVIYQRETPLELSEPLVVFDLRFSDPKAIRKEMVRRRDLLQEAIASDDPRKLPKCPWYNMRCEYSSVCDCEKSSIPTSYEIVDMVTEIVPNKETTQRFLTKLVEQRPIELLRMNDIVFPRKTYFARLQQQDAIDEEDISSEEAEKRLISIDRQGFLRVLKDVLQYGTNEDVHRIPVNIAGIKDRILLYNGSPTIVRVTGLSYIVEREQLPDVCSHYFLRLGFECAIGNNPKGRLVLYYRNIRQEDAKLMVYDTTFRNLDLLRAEVQRRAGLLHKATKLEELPKCPSWMCHYCEYAEPCGM
jgi:hypothetical protein